MLAQVTANASGNLSGISLIVSIVALFIALFSLPASILQYLTWMRDAALWIALAFVVVVVLKVGYQRSYGEGKSVTQAFKELLSPNASANEETSENESSLKDPAAFLNVSE